MPGYLLELAYNDSGWRYYSKDDFIKYVSNDPAYSLANIRPISDVDNLDTDLEAPLLAGESILYTLLL